MVPSHFGILAEVINMVITSQTRLTKIQSTQLVVFWIFLHYFEFFHHYFEFFRTNFNIFATNFDFLAVNTNFLALN